MMTVLFYLSGLLLVVATATAVTRRNAIHAVVWLVISFLATSLLFYLLGAPLLAMFEIIIFAGAIMVLFLFILLLVPLEAAVEAPARSWLPAVALGLAFGAASLVLLGAWPAARRQLAAARAAPADFGRFLFGSWRLPIILVGLLLFVGLVGALYLGRDHGSGERGEEDTR